MKFHRPAAVLAFVIGAVVTVIPARMTAQTSLSRLTLTASRIESFAEAARRRLNYLPGEVVVKFRSGTSVLGWQRALLSLRSRPPVTALRWHGQFAAFTDASESDSEVLASRLRE